MNAVLESLVRSAVSSNIFVQLLPFIVLFVVPLFTLKIVTFARRSLDVPGALMGLDSLAPWAWFSSSPHTETRLNGSLHHPHNKRKSRKLNTTVVKAESDVEDGYYPGLVNVSGTYCFMNSTVQALSSLSYLQPHIDSVHAKAEALDVPTPVIDVLQDIFHELNTPKSTHSSIRPVDLIAVLSSPSSARFNSLFSSRDHQDAQELFQLISECIKNETTNVDKEALRDRGLNGFSQEGGSTKDIGKSVFDGLTANRRSCVICQYTEAVMHFSFDNWQLAVPRLATSCSLEDCLEDYTRLEVLRDCICRMCSMRATHRRLQLEVATLAEATKPEAKPSASKKRRLKEVTKMEARVKAAIEQGRIEEDLKDIRLEKVYSQYSTKQAMIARPPQVLALHLNRSVHSSHYASKNNVRVHFPEVLDLTPFTTSGNLSTIPTSSLSTPSPLPPRSNTPTPATYANLNSRIFYRLSAIVCHYGQHSFGHYVCYRRKPRHPSSEDRWRPPKIIVRERLPGKEEDAASSPASEFDWEDTDLSAGAGTGRGWLRISDSSVEECGIESVLLEGSAVFMLYYERAAASLAPPSHPYANGNGVAYGVGTATPESSDETLKPEIMLKRSGNASISSLITTKSEGDDSKNLVSTSPHANPRILRSVATGKGRTSRGSSIATTGRARSSSPTASPTPRTNPISIPNGGHQVKFEEDDGLPPSMSSSAPALLPSVKLEDGPNGVPPGSR